MGFGPDGSESTEGSGEVLGRALVVRLPGLDLDLVEVRRLLVLLVLVIVEEGRVVLEKARVLDNDADELIKMTKSSKGDRIGVGYVLL